MKKWLILAAALLLTFAAGVKYQRHQASFENAGLSSAPPPDLVSLPDGGKVYAIPAAYSAAPAKPPATYGALPTIKEKAFDIGPCRGGSLNEIFSAHGRIWGDLARHGSFRNTESDVVYNLVGKYLACVGLARGTRAFCDYLPSGSRGEKGDLQRSNSPNYKCRELYADAEGRAGSAAGCTAESRFLCDAFLSKSEASCSATLAKLGASYCAYLAEAKKRAGGYAGFSPEEIQASFKKDEEEKTAAEKLRLENEKITEDINKRVRKMMGKPDAPR